MASTSPREELPARTSRPAASVWQTSLGERSLLAFRIALLLMLTVAVATRTWQDREWLGYLLLAVTATVWLPELARPRIYRVWFAYVAGIFFYTLLRARADETAIPVRTDYVIEMDRFLFFGADPVVSLQRQFFNLRDIDFLDWSAVALHWSFFVAPHALAVGIFLFRRTLFPQYVLLVVGLMYVSLVLFILVPTTPPWLAAVQGDFPYVFRVMDWVGHTVGEETYVAFYESLGEPNSVAAMPSLHMAITVVMALWAWEHARQWAGPLAVYALLMGVALVYMAEHYVVDLLVGALLAALWFLFVRRYFRPKASPASEPSPQSSAVPAPKPTHL